MLMLHKQKREEGNITTLRISPESHLHWKNHFHKNQLCFRFYADFESGNQIEYSSRGNKTTNIYKQNPVLNGYHIESGLKDVLHSGYHKSPLAYNIVDRFVNEVKKLENKMTFYYKNSKKDIIMTKKDEEENRNIIICQFCEKNFESDKVRDHCQLTGDYRGPAHSKCNIIVTQDQFYTIYISQF